MSEDLEFELSEERRELCTELATYRGELINGFTYPSRKQRCTRICLRLAQIDALLEDEE